MSNLLITIISIALIAVAASMGIFYGGQAYSQAQINAAANAMLNESQQLLAASRLWATNNNQPDISGMPGAALDNGVYTPQQNFSGIQLLISDGELSSHPSLMGSFGSLSTAGVSIWPADYSCYNINGYQGFLNRSLLATNGGNYVVYEFGINVPYTAPCTTENGQFSSSTTDTSQANHPIVLIAKAINNTLKQIPSAAGSDLMPYLGLPTLPAGSTEAAAFTAWVDSNGNIQANYCYVQFGTEIFCTFGPS